jgi:putative transcriptional regulator
MTTIRHHLTDAILMAYAAGELPEAFSLVVATHVSMCDDCRAALAAHEAVGGAILEAADEADGGDWAEGALGACLARLDSLPQANARAHAPRRGILPAPLADYVGGDVGAVKWKTVGMGVRQAILPTDRAATARLLWIPGGAAMPDHGHRGTEMTIVLQGAFSDGADRFGPGDVETVDPDVEHTPVAEPGVPCICLAASDAPLRFKGMIPRLAQPLFRI